MARLTADNERLAHEIIARYPRPKSALIPLLHLAQEQDGYLTDDAMEHVGELVHCTPAEVLGTASFYEMLKLEPVGTYVVNICTDISCMLVGGDEMLHRAEEHLEIKAGQTTADGSITLEGATCIAACTEAPCLQANYRYRYRLTAESLEAFLDDLQAGRADGVPPHGTLATARQHIPEDRRAGAAYPDASAEPVWMGNPTATAGGGS